MSAVLERVQVVLYEGAGSAAIDERVGLTTALLERGYAVSMSRERGRLGANQARLMVVLGCFDDAPPAVASSAETELCFEDIRGLEIDAVVARVDALRDGQALPEPKAWKPWFPVIDHDRCTDCMQCLSFCLFDVYGVDDAGHISVQKPTNCKTDCPACSRVCPDVAILFPKYRAGPINGAEIDEEDLKRESMKVDISALLGGNIYEALRNRSAKAKSRFSKERSEDKALEERRRCLGKLRESMDIPLEVLSALPSLSEIQQRSEEAKERGRIALEGQQRKETES